ncbi:unnamed protein product [marine sediment metagenome]|uniref:Uncharacterized protein n=1 Tax=marine sediment metagenome TaxID=412755 RepID=X1FJ31_9ZZZZ
MYFVVEFKEPPIPQLGLLFLIKAVDIEDAKNVIKYRIRANERYTIKVATIDDMARAIHFINNVTLMRR